jgi:hypothetical protein
MGSTKQRDYGLLLAVLSLVVDVIGIALSIYL